MWFVSERIPGVPHTLSGVQSGWAVHGWEHARWCPATPMVLYVRRTSPEPGHEHGHGTTLASGWSGQWRGLHAADGDSYHDAGATSQFLASTATNASGALHASSAFDSLTHGHRSAVGTRRSARPATRLLRWLRASEPAHRLQPGTGGRAVRQRCRSSRRRSRHGLQRSGLVPFLRCRDSSCALRHSVSGSSQGRGCGNV
mmetsp:Transcript_81461/g.189188  ORF Transcript_81461/g.189188 Transcript_81461/m.189188 type:complete len:200 (-) Transcript_81461:151-750(-)